MTKHSRHSLALEYHENTKALAGNRRFDPKNQYKIYPSARKIKLDSVESLSEGHDQGDFLRTLLMRRSTRAFSQDGIGLRELARLLTLSFGLRGTDSSGLSLRTYASAGARYPVEVYPVVLRSADVEPGIYHYNVAENSLELIKAGDFTSQLHAFYRNQEFPFNPPCIIFFSMVFARSMEKYGERGYRFILLDAGHMSQNLYLAAEYLGLGAVALGAGMDSDANNDALLGLAGGVESVFYGFAVGLPQTKTGL